MNLSQKCSGLSYLVLCSAACCWFGCSSQKEQAIPEATWEAQIAAVKKGESDRIEVAQQAIGDEQLQQLEGLDQLRELLIEKGKMTSASLPTLTKLSRLEHLKIRGAAINDQGFRHLCAIHSLKRLNLPQADLTDEGLLAIADLKELESFRFGSPRVTDTGVLHIGNVKTLRWLHLIDIPLTDSSLDLISMSFPQLESLYIDGGKFSDKAWDNLFAKRPGLHVHVDQKHHDRDPHGHSH
jgi:hypothetical protein